jgi:ABC-type lipoprotein release transport system permease subunit
MFLPKLALRNLFRHPNRTIITGIAIAVGVAGFILFDSLLEGWFSETERGYMDYEVASGRIVRESWWQEREQLPLSESITETERVTSILEELDIPYTPRTEFMAELVFYEDPYPASGVYPSKVVAIDPDRDAEIFELAHAMENPASEGNFISEDSNDVVVGSALAHDLHMEVGYPVRLQVTGMEGSREIVAGKVAGLVKTDSPIHNTTGVYMSLQAAEEYLRTDGAVTGYAFELPGGRAGRRARAELRERLPEEYRILGYEELAEDFVAMQQAESGGANIMIFLVFVIAAVGVSNTMMMSVFERRREIGMLRAQGLRDRAIHGLFFLEGAGIGLVGAALGVAVGALVNIPLVNVGLNYGLFFPGESGDVIDMGAVALPSYLTGMWRPQVFLAATLLAVAVSSLVTWFPTRRLLRQDIPTNLRID